MAGSTIELLSMNKIEAISADYITSSRTIEVYQVSNENGDVCTFFLFNRDGISFRLFSSALEMVKFFRDETHVSIHFEKEKRLDKYLMNYHIKRYPLLM